MVCDANNEPYYVVDFLLTFNLSNPNPQVLMGLHLFRTITREPYVASQESIRRNGNLSA